MMAQVAAVLHFTLAELDEMDLAELRQWHAEAVKIFKAMRGR
jgi:hypothetical protein